MIFPLKYDLKIISVMILIVVILSVPAIVYFPTVWSILFISFIIVTVVSFTFFNYKVTDDALIVKCGIFRWKIFFKDIKSIELSQNPNRVKIKYKRNSMAILSLESTEKFKKYLEGKCYGSIFP